MSYFRHRVHIRPDCLRSVYRRYFVFCRLPDSCLRRLNTQRKITTTDRCVICRRREQLLLTNGDSTISWQTHSKALEASWNRCKSFCCNHRCTDLYAHCQYFYRGNTPDPIARKSNPLSAPFQSVVALDCPVSVNMKAFLPERRKISRPLFKDRLYQP